MQTLLTLADFSRIYGSGHVVHRTIGAWRVWIDQPGQTHSRLGSTEGATHSASCTIDVSIRCVARHPPTQIAEAHGMPPVEIISRETSLYKTRSQSHPATLHHMEIPRSPAGPQDKPTLTQNGDQCLNIRKTPTLQHHLDGGR